LGRERGAKPQRSGAPGRHQGGPDHAVQSDADPDPEENRVVLGDLDPDLGEQNREAPEGPDPGLDLGELNGVPPENLGLPVGGEEVRDLVPRIIVGLGHHLELPIVVAVVGAGSPGTCRIILRYGRLPSPQLGRIAPLRDI